MKKTSKKNCNLIRHIPVQKVNSRAVSFVLYTNDAINMVPAQYCRPLYVDMQKFADS